MDIFFRKWKDEVEFLQYFKAHWYDQNINWYEGAKFGCPSTNNALEATNNK